jgi:hypothetical protein
MHGVKKWRKIEIFKEYTMTKQMGLEIMKLEKNSELWLKEELYTHEKSIYCRADKNIERHLIFILLKCTK